MHDEPEAVRSGRLAWLLPAATLAATSLYYYGTKSWAFGNFLHVWPLDFAQFIQSVWNASHGRGLTESVHLDGLNFLAVHFSPVLYFEAAVLRLVPRIEALLALRVVCMVLLPGIAILVWARRNRNLDSLFTTLLLVLLFFNPLFHANVLNDIRSESLILGFMVLAYLALALSHMPLWILSNIAILAMKENGALVVVCLGLYALATGRRAFGQSGLALGIVGLITGIAVFRHFGGHRNAALYTDVLDLNLGRIVLSVGYKLLYALLWILTLCLLPVLRWRWSRILLFLPYALVYLPMNGRAGAGFDDYHVHYTATLLGALYVLTLDSIGLLSAIPRYRKRTKYSIAAGCAALAVYGATLHMPFSYSWWHTRSSFDVAERTDTYRSILAGIPDTSGVAVTSSLVPNLSMRERVKLFDYKSDLAEIEFIVADARDPMPHKRGVLAKKLEEVRNSPDWQETSRQGAGISVFRRRPR